MPIPDDGAGLMMVAVLLAGLSAITGGLIFIFGRRPPSRPEQLMVVAGTQPASPPGPSWSVGNRPVDDDEAGTPRWLRASVRAERSWTPSRDTGRRADALYLPVAFTEPAPEGSGRIVRYDDVNVFAAPNESYAEILTRLHAGDEVVVTDSSEDWAQVRTPKGVTGWVSSMALVAVQPPATIVESVDAPPMDKAPGPAARPRRRRSARRPADKS